MLVQIGPKSKLNQMYVPFLFLIFDFPGLYFTRSFYFQQIEEDVQNKGNDIIELRSSVTNFKTKEMTELIKFHKDVESLLEKLTDESQVSLIALLSNAFIISINDSFNNH
jgi:hypothetical protein